MANQGQIRITPERMFERAKEYLGEAEAIGQVISKMDTLINELQSEWEGQASAKFADQYNELKPSFQKMQELTETIAKQLQQTGNAMQQMDQDIANQFGVR
ncbi:MAG: hypothetical protein K0R54_5825 [Clostridiaceae bacterium]|jgi:WXG100 family type VII secretion target|uniref:ESAT-6-like protein n=1 Tax=Clostridium saccharoperbutylacetonicum N1-4(HMT) TaxID=931276 RepID=M1MGG0_9CLOT|nr:MULTISPECIES: WXG100 family type VII secretion target [Clostridium]MDF2885253.1 hypothetical protein [Clostridiaceae bacterium]AGF54056.1 hypothetical protein Cspa_c02380 [Clostridium saccharoperbutylacetonicum N1-4(HMT)]AQR92960.1 virulence factor EsxA [Clostridium saccharoperbutylacetonicum]NRT59431.1 WXG100 family type VII secretion target [Clostridium saccharoperbutylacetonicum]NSB28622.1 WXG100 family type VII secretion target [Clostridium saccharoperbutylacetonicum]